MPLPGAAASGRSGCRAVARPSAESGGPPRPSPSRRPLPRCVLNSDRYGCAPRQRDSSSGHTAGVCTATGVDVVEVMSQSEDRPVAVASSPWLAIVPRLAIYVCIALVGSCLGPLPATQASVAERLVESTRGRLAEWTLPVFLAMLPIVELRGAIPVSILVLQMDPLTVFVLAIIGNMVPVPFILLGLKPLADFASERSQFWKRLFDRVFDRARTQTEAWKEHYFAAIAVFVGIPLPGTGAYSGSIACFVLGLPFWKSFFANLTGVVISASIMITITLAGQWGWKLL